MAGIQSIGTQLWLKKAGEEQADLKIANLTSAGDIKGTAEEIDVTDHDSPGGNKEFIAGAVDYGEFSFEGNLVTVDLAEKLFALLNSKESRQWYVKYTDGSQMDVKGPLKEFGLSARTTDGLNAYAGAIRIGEQPVFHDVAPVTP